MARSRWELEENKKKKKQDLLEQAKQIAQDAGNPAKAAERVSSQLKQNAAQQSSSRTSGGFSGSTSRSSSSGTKTSTGSKSSAPSSPVRITSTQDEEPASGLRDISSFASQLRESAAEAAARPGRVSNSRESILEGGAARRRSNVDARTGTNISHYGAERDLQRNQTLWHLTDDAAERAALNAENNRLRERLGLAYDPASGVTYDPKTGRNYSLPVQSIFGGTAVDQIRAANQWRQSRDAFGMDENDTSMLPTYEQIRQSGDVQTAKGVTAHEVMAELYSRGDEAWTDQDTTARDQAVEALSQEMQTILARYGLSYSPRETGPEAGTMTNDSNAVERLRAAGADDTTIRYVQENISMREAADRLGQGAEAVAKRVIGSIPALVETVQQQAANAAESRENPEYVRLEERAQQLENQLTSMQSTDLDGSLNADYVQVYNALQDVRKQMNELAVKTPTDQSRFGQRMLREAAEAQSNATAGLAAVPRFLTNTGMSIVSNAPGIAAGMLIPGIGQAVGLGIMGASAAGQRAQELSADGAAPSEALARGIVSGVIEAVTERMPIEELAAILSRGGRDAVRSILRQMGVEATEESASYLMNYAADWAANDPNAQFSLAELAEQALGGAVSGGVFGGAATIGGRMAGTGAQTAQESAGTTQAGNDTTTAQAPETGRYASTLARLDQELQQAEGLLPGPARDAQVAALRQEMERVAQMAQMAAQAGTQDIAARTAGAQARSSGMQQGAWPEGATRPRLQGEEEFLEPGEMQQAEPAPAAPVRQAAGAAGQQTAAEMPMQGQISLAEQPIIEAQARNRALRQLDSQIQQAQQTIAELTQQKQDLESVPFGADRAAWLEEIDMEIDDTWRELAAMQQQWEQLAAAQAANPVSMRQFQNWRQEQAARDFAAAGEPVQDGAGRTGVETVQPRRLAQTLAELEMQGQQPQPQQQPQQPQPQQQPQQPQPPQQTAGGQMAMPGFEEQAAAPQEAGSAETPADVPLSDAFSYGETPQQAMREAEMRAQDEAAQEAYQTEREETVSDLLHAWELKYAAEKQAERTLEGLSLTQHDIEMAQNAARTGVNTQKWSEADNPEKARMYGSVLRAVKEADRPIRQFFAQRAAALESEAQKAADAIAQFAKDKRFGGAYQRETMERNIRDIFGKKHKAEAEAIIREYITPVHKAVAEGTRLKNSMRERVKALRLDKHERALVQMRLEAEDGAAAEYIANNKVKMTPQRDAKIRHAVTEFRDIYNELYNQINETLLLNGQEPAPFRKNYAPHFTKDKPDTLLGRVRLALGLGKDSNLDLPTDIAGITDTFRPGKKWFGNLLQREGEITDYDAVAGFDQYVETAADVITLTESIQKLRALEDQVRYTLSDEGVKARIDAIRNDPDMDALQQRQKIEEIYDDNRTSVQQLIDDLRNQKRMGMGRFVTELRRYTDNLAGKKSREDRGWEDMANRQVYQLAKSMEGRVAANMISLNPGSWLTNVIPITQATGEVSVPNLVRGMYQTAKAAIKDDGYRDASAFLTNRYGSERLDKTLGRRVSDISGAPMELIDHFTANTIHRARYAQNIDRGMGVNEAIEDADAYTASLMADRSKGALPTAFNATNPARKVFTMFQTEVNNQLSYLFKDMPKAQREKGVAAVAWAYTKVFGAAYLFNLAYSRLTGRDSAFDPIGIIADALGQGDDEDEERTIADRLAGVAEDVGGNIPFIGGVLFDGGRVPISSAIPNFANLGKAIMPGAFGMEWTGDKRLQTALKEIAKPLTYLVPPFGGGAAKRTIEGFATVNAGGSYTYDNEGNRTLQFPVYGQTPLEYAQMMLFGKWSSDEAQQYIDSGFQGLSADETAAFDMLRNNMGVDGREAMDAILSLRGFETIKDAEGNTELTVKAQQRLALFNNDDLTPEQKAAIDQALLVSGEDEVPADYTDRNAFLIGQYVSESRRDDAREAITHGLDIDQFVEWDNTLRELTNEKDDNDEAVRSEAEARRMTMEQLLQDTTLSSGEKQAIADYVIIPTMSESAQEDWASEGRGHVNATDFVTWRSRISELENEKDDNDEKVYTSAEAREQLLDELQSASSMTAERREAIAEYVIIPSMGEADEKTREDWANIAKGTVSAYTYIRFKDEISIYEKEFSGTGADNMENVAQILREYDGLSDEQRDVLFQCYNDTLKNNPFHVSSYETAIMDNQFYKDLSEDGKAALRSLTNEYEQAINEGKELSSWLAKAYMANKEASIAPGVYALYRVALKTVDAQVNDDGRYSQAEAQAAVESLPGLSQYQKAYLYQSTSTNWKNNPYGSVTVGEYQSGKEDAINPIDSGRLSSSFGPRSSPTAGASSWHKAIDIAADAGTPIKSVMSGTVTAVNKSGYGGGYGVSVRVDHGNGIITEYHHMQEGSADNINVGDKVSQGQQIGKVGSTGVSTGPHLDMQAWVDGKIVDPLTIIPGYGEGPSGYVFDGTVSSGVVSSGVADAIAAKDSGGSSGSSSFGLKKPEGLKGLKSLF